MAELTFADLPPRPWEPDCEPPAEVFADWLLSLSREQVVWLVDRQQRVWVRESECFIRNHAREITELRDENARLIAAAARLLGEASDG